MSVKPDRVFNIVRDKTVKSYLRGIFAPLQHIGEGEVQQVLSRLADERRIIAQILTGSGLRVAEVVRLQVQSIDFEQSQILVGEGKGAQDDRYNYGLERTAAQT